MIDVTDDWWIAPLIAAGFGLVGGFAYELLQTRKGGQTGMIEFPGARLRKLYDLGFVASMLLGAIAAAAFLIAYTPTESTETVDGVVKTTQEYSGIALVAISLIVGAAGSSVLGALTKAVTKAAEGAKLETIQAGLNDTRADLERTRLEPDPDATNAGVDQAGAKVEVLNAQVEAMLSE
jgi:hypothetical protein